MEIKIKTKKVNVCQVKPNDYIKSFDINSNKIKFNRVNEIIPSVIEKGEQVRVCLENDDEMFFSKNTKVYVFDNVDWSYTTICDLIEQIQYKPFFMIDDNGQKIKISKIYIGGEYTSPEFIDFNVENDHNFFVKRPNDKKFKLIHNSGACTVALDSWHLDIEDFLELQTENGDQRVKAFDIFPQVVLSDEFMERVVGNKPWILFDPFEIKTKLGIDIAVTWGDEFKRAYAQIEQMVYRLGKDNGVYLENLMYEDFEKAYKTLSKTNGDIDDKRYLRLIKKISAKELFKTIMKTQVETGMPYIAFKDAINRANPNKHCGMIGNGNLCLSGETVVDIILDGNKERIRLVDLVDMYKTNKNILIKSVNHHTNDIEYKKITEAFLINNFSKVLKITDEKTGKHIICTADHKVWTENRGYVMAKNLQSTDELKII